MWLAQSELEGFAKPMLEGLPAGGAASPPQSKYLGGDFR